MFLFLRNIDDLINSWTALYNIRNETELAAIRKLGSNPVAILDAINTPYVRNIMKNNFDKCYLKILSQDKKRKPRVHAILVALAIRNRFMLQPELMNLNYQEVLASFRSNDRPELFNNLSEDECLYLARHMLTTKEMMRVIEPKHHQGLYIAVGVLMENSNIIYTAGGDLPKTSRRRQDIFQKLSGVIPAPRKQTRTPQQQAVSATTTTAADEDRSDNEEEEEGEEEVEDNTMTQQYVPPTSQQSSSPFEVHQASIPFAQQPQPQAQAQAPPAIPILYQQQPAMDVDNDDDCALTSFNTRELMDIIVSIPQQGIGNWLSSSSFSSFPSPPVAAAPASYSYDPVSPAAIHLQPASFQFQPPHLPVSSNITSSSAGLQPQQQQPQDDDKDCRLIPFDTQEMIRIFDRELPSHQNGGPHHS